MGILPQQVMIATVERLCHSDPRIVIFEEVAALRRRGFAGLCIAGVGPDGWLENWHLPVWSGPNRVGGGPQRATTLRMTLRSGWQ